MHVCRKNTVSTIRSIDVRKTPHLQRSAKICQSDMKSLCCYCRIRREFIHLSLNIYLPLLQIKERL